MARRAEWDERTDRRERSDLEVGELARCEADPPVQFERRRREAIAPKRRRAEPRSQGAHAAKRGPTTTLMPAPSAWIEFRLPYGGLVRLLPGLDAATAACVLVVAAALSCRKPHDLHTCASPPSRSGGIKK